MGVREADEWLANGLLVMFAGVLLKLAAGGGAGKPDESGLWVLLPGGTVDANTRGCSSKRDQIHRACANPLKQTIGNKLLSVQSRFSEQQRIVLARYVLQL